LRTGAGMLASAFILALETRNDPDNVDARAFVIVLTCLDGMNSAGLTFASEILCWVGVLDGDELAQKRVLVASPNEFGS
jgi:hypothetical protein